MRMVVAAVMMMAACAARGAGAQDPQGVRLDFQDIELGLVISALADAGNFNLVYTDLPERRVTLRMNQPVPRDQILPLLRSIAASNGLRVVQDGPLLRVEAAGPAGLSGPDQVVPELETRIFVYRLLHAQAGSLAATLQAMFGLSGAAALQPGATGPTSLSQLLRGQQVPPLDPDAAEVAAELGVAQGGIAGDVRGDVVIVPDEPTNSLIVRARSTDWEVLEQAIQALDLRPLQVLIEVVIAEVQRSSDLEVGITGEVERAGETSVQGSLGGFTGGDLAVNLMRAGTVSLDVTLSALSRSGNVRILSRPIVLAQNNQEATILIGAERPFIQVFRSLPTETAVRDQIVQYRDVGTSLAIVPTINQDGYVNLDVTQGVSTATEEEQFGAPVISTREASTRLFVRTGQTVVIGGLIDQQEELRRSGIPLLKDIPVLGLLFGSTQRSSLHSELFIFLTPHVIQTDEDADRLRDELESRSRLHDALPGAAADTNGVQESAPRN